MRKKIPRPATTVSLRLDCALARMKAKGMTPRAIYLTPADFKQFCKETTRAYRDATGSSAFLHPLSHNDVMLISEKLIVDMIPVRESSGKHKSTIYSIHGVEQSVPVYA